MAYYHGIKTSQISTSISTPVVAACGIPFVVGTAPVHTAGGKANEIVLANTYSEAVEALGYSDDWESYTLCEMIYSHFKLYDCSPVIFVNVLDPSVHKKTIPATEFTITNEQVKLPLEYLIDTVKVTSAESGGTTYVLNTDYTLFYDDDCLKLEIVDGGAITGTSIFIEATAVDPTLVTKTDIIGGYNASTGITSGMELIESVFAKCNIIPDLILAPGWSSDSEVAAVMQAKATGINDMFAAKALIDADCKTVTNYKDVVEWKNNNSITKKEQFVFWPMVTLSGKKYHMSVQMAGVIAQTDSDNGDCPSASPSNKEMQIDGLCTADGTEVLLDITQANHLNTNGIATAINFIGGFKSWGNESAAYPASTDVKDYFICVSRTFDWVAKTAIQTFWAKLDNKMNRRLIDNIVDTFNIYLNGLVSEEKILGGRIEFLSNENSTTDLMAGKMKFHVYLTPPSPAEEMDFTFEYDTSYIEKALTV
ncbi:MAG: phage tail sheath subtilisin-like domain-containing protein [Clostridia bacterium]|jgi:phage tail sheath protein FI|nr:phage tail sheath subtilisin-like domain-containing protein [Clostridia bacterium]